MLVSFFICVRRERTYDIFLVSGRSKLTLPRATSRELRLNIALRQRHSRRNTINHTSNTFTMTLTVRSYSKQRSECAHFLFSISCSIFDFSKERKLSIPRGACVNTKKLLKIIIYVFAWIIYVLEKKINVS